MSTSRRAGPARRATRSSRSLSELSDTDLRGLFYECAHGPDGGVDVVKVVAKAESAQCSIRINQAALAVQPLLPPATEALIAICTTDAGRLSRALNVMLGPTPVAHPSLPGKAAPGQLSAVEIERIRQTLGLHPNPFSAPDTRRPVPQGSAPPPGTPEPKRPRAA